MNQGVTISAPNILALDISSRCTGVAEGRAGESPRLYGVRPRSEPDDYADVFARSLRWTAERLAVCKFDVVYVEAPRSPGMHGDTNADTTFKLIGLWATISSVVIYAGIKCRSVSVKDVREGFIGARNRPGAVAKSQVIEMCGRLGLSASDDNEGDAAALWWFACQKEARALCPVITPMMHHEVATSVENAKILKEQEARKRKLGRLRV